MQFAHGFLDRLFDELSLVLSVVFEHFAGEQAKLRDELPLLNSAMDIAVQRKPADEGAVPVGIGVIRTAMRCEVALRVADRCAEQRMSARQA